MKSAAFCAALASSPSLSRGHNPNCHLVSTLIGNPVAVGEPVPGRSSQVREHPTIFGGVWPPRAAVPGWTSSSVCLIMQQAGADGRGSDEGIGTMADAPRVFLSYSHDSAEHATRVLALADALRRRTRGHPRSIRPPRSRRGLAALDGYTHR